MFSTMWLWHPAKFLMEVRSFPDSPTPCFAIWKLGKHTTDERVTLKIRKKKPGAKLPQGEHGPVPSQPSTTARYSPDLKSLQGGPSDSTGRRRGVL
jgi:hypothetical protein